MKLANPNREHQVQPHTPIIEEIATVTSLPSGWTVPRLSDWLKSAQEEPMWLVERFLPHNGITLISGQQKKTNKTWFANVLAVACASGKDIAGIKPVKQVPVLYLEEEGHVRGTRNTFEALCKGHGLDSRDFPDCNDVFFAFRNRIKLDELEWKKRLYAFIREHNIGLVICDAITYMHTGDENKTSDMVKVADSIQTIRSLGCAIVLIVHLDKARGGSTTADHDAQIRGSTVVADAYDLHLAFRRYKWTEPFIKCHTYNRHGRNLEYRLKWDRVANNDDPDMLETLRLSIEEITEEKNYKKV